MWVRSSGGHTTGCDNRLPGKAKPARTRAGHSLEIRVLVVLGWSFRSSQKVRPKGVDPENQGKQIHAAAEIEDPVNRPIVPQQLAGARKGDQDDAGIWEGLPELP